MATETYEKYLDLIDEAYGWEIDEVEDLHDEILDDEELTEEEREDLLFCLDYDGRREEAEEKEAEEEEAEENRALAGWGYVMDDNGNWRYDDE